MTSYSQSGLSKVEAVCIDNCVKKFMEFNHVIQVHLREMQEPMTLEMLKHQQMELGREMGLWPWPYCHPAHCELLFCIIYLWQPIVVRILTLDTHHMAEWKPEDDGLSPDFRLTNFTGLKGNKRAGLPFRCLSGSVWLIVLVITNVFRVRM